MEYSIIVEPVSVETPIIEWEDFFERRFGTNKGSTVSCTSVDTSAEEERYKKLPVVCL